VKRIRSFMPTAAQDRADGLSRPSLAADYFPEVTRVDAQLEHSKLLAFNRADLNLVRDIDEGLCDCLYEFLHMVRLGARRYQVVSTLILLHASGAIALPRFSFRGHRLFMGVGYCPRVRDFYRVQEIGNEQKRFGPM
jgi:hypothetical protein